MYILKYSTFKVFKKDLKYLAKLLSKRFSVEMNILISQPIVFIFNITIRFISSVEMIDLDLE